MRNTFLFIMAILLSSCSVTHTTNLLPPKPTITSSAPLPALILVEPEIIEPILAAHNNKIKLAPFTPSLSRCGGVYYDEQEDIRRIIENAKVIIRLTGVYEEWIPINGEPKKYYVLKIE